ncbi:MAG: ribosome biogenesis GTPase Der [Prevotellaceae bacterium]|jgi:GTP-binding protein|nr:ribosome biogenesis GTPase Der [Prevotellaceae bacterium]
MGIVAIVGRPNVGKSTLFNRLVGGRQAIVDEQSGVTRDRHYGKSDWNGKTFSVIDTGGYAVNSDDVFEEEIRKQVVAAIGEADVILFMVDVTCGVTAYDDAVANILRRSNKKVLLVVNKVDNNNRIYDAHEFHKLGLGEPYCVCAMSGSGTGEILDEAVKHLADSAAEDDTEIPRVAIIGKPNVGKSSIANALLGEERNIVTPIAGTTRDAVLSRYSKFGHDFFLVDTAGLRKKGKVHENLEFYSVMRTIRVIERSDVCILMMDATQGVEAQDLNIFKLIVRNSKGCVVAVNKWDLVEKDSNTMKGYREAIQKRLAPFSDVPIIFTSATEKQRLLDVIKAVSEVYERRRQHISTAKLNEALLPVIEAYPPPAIKGKYIKIKYVTQLSSPSPVFAFFCNLPQYVKEPYKRFLENKLREKYNFCGVPIHIYLRQK